MVNGVIKDMRQEDIKTLLEEFDYYTYKNVNQLSYDNMKKIIDISDIIRKEGNKIQNSFDFEIPQYILYEIVKLKYKVNKDKTKEVLKNLLGIAILGGSLSKENREAIQTYIKEYFF